MIEVAIGVSEDGYVEVTVPKEVNTNSEIVINGTYDLLGKMFNSEEK